LLSWLCMVAQPLKKANEATTTTFESFFTPTPLSFLVAL
jgi:hypothetical protein